MTILADLITGVAVQPALCLIRLYPTSSSSSKFLTRVQTKGFKSRCVCSGNTNGTGSSSTALEREFPEGHATGAKAGIGVGAILDVLMLIALGFFLFRRRARHHANTTVPPDGTYNEHKAELHQEAVKLNESNAVHISNFVDTNPAALAELETHDYRE